MDGLSLAEKIQTHTVRLVSPYPLFERIRILIAEHGGQTLNENFAGDVTLTLQFAAKSLPGFQDALREISKGTLQAEITDTNPAAIFPVVGVL